MFSNEDLAKAEKRVREWRAECRKKRHDVVVSSEAERALVRILAQLINKMSQIRRRDEPFGMRRAHFDRARNILDAWVGESIQNNCDVQLSEEADANLLMMLVILVAGASPRIIWGFPVDIEGAFVN